MIDRVKEKCYGCSACTTACPKSCISMVDKGEGFLYPELDRLKCIECNICEKVCPVLNQPKENDEYLTYAAYNVDDIVRKNSSSGGVFSAMATKILEENGIVYGAAFTENYQSVKHIRIDDISELPKLYTSKYMQSRTEGIYARVFNDVKNGRTVMFNGTPCQIGGLKSYLGKEYRNLIYVDFVCHGVPSEKIWRLYTDQLIKKYKHNIDSVNFRSKEFGWNPLLLLLGRHKFKESQGENIYYQAFLTDLCLRKSCYQCQFKGKYGFSDISLADFWGINEIYPEMNDGKGTSLVFVNSEKGITYFNDIKKNLVIRAIDDERILEHNPSRMESAEYNKSRDAYMFQVNKDNFNKLTWKCIGKPFKERIKLKAIKVLSKLYRLLLKSYSRAIKL